jgi:hypothetical protein
MSDVRRSDESDDLRVMRDCQRGIRCTLTDDCGCPVSGVVLSVAALRVLYAAASSYDSRLPADAHRPLWANAIEEVLASADASAQEHGEPRG